MTWFVAVGLTVGVVHHLAAPRGRDVTLPASLVMGVLGAVTGGMVVHMLVADDLLELRLIGIVVAAASALAVLRSAEAEAAPS